MYKCVTWDQHSKMFQSLYSGGVMRAKPAGTGRVLSLVGFRYERRKRGNEQKIPASREEERRWTGGQSKRFSGLVEIGWMGKRGPGRGAILFLHLPLWEPLFSRSMHHSDRNPSNPLVFHPFPLPFPQSFPPFSARAFQCAQRCS